MDIEKRIVHKKERCRSFASRSKVRWYSALVISCVLILYLGSAGAAEVKIRAMALAPLPNDTTIEIRASENTELSHTIAGTFAERLRQNGYQVTQQGSLILRFAVDIDEFGNQRQSRVSVQGQGGDKQGVSGDLSVRLGSASSTKKGERMMRLRTSVGRPGKPPLWTGYATGSLAGTDRLTLGRALAEKLSVFLGRDAQADSPLPVE